MFAAASSSCKHHFLHKFTHQFMKSRSVMSSFGMNNMFPATWHTWILSKKVPCFSSSVTLAPRDKSIWRHIIGLRSGLTGCYLKKCGIHPPKFNGWNLWKWMVSKFGISIFQGGLPIFRGSNVCFWGGVITKVIIFSIDLNGILCGSQFE